METVRGVRPTVIVPDVRCRDEHARGVLPSKRSGAERWYANVPRAPPAAITAPEKDMHGFAVQSFQIE
jgi:hypothetical protein